MRIADLPHKLQQLCFQRQKEQGNLEDFTGNLDTGTYGGNFNWGNTSEGYEFWYNIEQGHIPPQYIDSVIINDYSIF